MLDFFLQLFFVFVTFGEKEGFSAQNNKISINIIEVSQ
jgi:hypothetical protein